MERATLCCPANKRKDHWKSRGTGASSGVSRGFKIRSPLFFLEVRCYDSK
jgi:hypothetical protein